MLNLEKAVLKPSKVCVNIYDAMLLSGAILGFGTSLMLAGSLDKASKAALSTVGMAGLIGYTVNAKVNEKTRRVSRAIDQVQWESLKYHLKENEMAYRLQAETEGTQRKVDMIIEKSQPWAWWYWAKRVGVTENMPPVEQLTSEHTEQPANAIAPRPMVSTEFVDFVEEAPDLVGDFAGVMKNSLIVGVPGSGKGLFVSNALGQVQARGDTTVFYLDPKNDPKESGYFEGRVDFCFRLPKGVLGSQPEEILTWLENCLAVYEEYQDSDRKLLILDELTAVMKKLKSISSKAVNWLEEKISTYCASGDSAGIVFWGIGQNAHNTGTGMDGGTKSQLIPVALISTHQLSASQALMKADFIPADKRLNSDEIKLLCQQSPIGRAVFHGGLNQWFPMPVLPNPSGYDRDNRKWMEKPQEQARTQDVPPPVTLRDIESVLIEWMRSLDELPPPDDVRAKWEEITGQRLNDDQLANLLKTLGLEE